MTLLTIWTYRQNQTDQTVPDLIGKQQWRWQIGQQNARVGRRLPQLGCPTWSLWKTAAGAAGSGKKMGMGFNWGTVSLHHYLNINWTRILWALPSNSGDFMCVACGDLQRSCPQPWRALSATTGPWQRHAPGDVDVEYAGIVIPLWWWEKTHLLNELPWWEWTRTKR